MIRYSSSFFISLIIHGLVLLSIYLTYKINFTPKKEFCEPKICMKVCSLRCEVQKPVSKKQISKPKIKQELKPKSKPKVKPKLKIKTKKVIVKKIKKQKIKLKKELKQKIEPKQKTKIIEVKKEPIKIKVKVSKPIVTKPISKVVDKKILEIKKTIIKKVPKDFTKEYVQLNTQEISTLLKENLYYPRSARKRGIVGKIIVKFTLGLDAKVFNISVVKSNSKILSRAAIKTIESLSEKFPKPKKEIILSVPISYSLR